MIWLQKEQKSLIECLPQDQSTGFLLRADNADLRLTPLGLEIGCVGPERQAFLKKDPTELKEGFSLAKSVKFSPDAFKKGIKINKDGKKEI